MRGVIPSPAVRLVLLAALFWHGPARADLEGRDIHLRVMATSVPVRTGPGGSFREIGRVGRGQVYEALDRSYDGAWYRIRLARGVSGWVLAELVWPFEVVDEAGLSATQGWLYDKVLAESKLADGKLVFTIAGGALGADGMFSLRLGYQPSRHWIIELMAGQSVGHLGSLAVYGVELLVAIGPWRTLVPFAAVGAGAATTLPHREGSLFAESTRPLLTAGGGLLLALRGGVTLRFDARQMMAFSEEELWEVVALTGGLMLAF